MIDINKMLKNSLKKTNGIIPAIILTSVKVMRELMRAGGVKLKNLDANDRKSFAKIERILTHKDPHLDEYMAALILRAALPGDKKMIPLEETALWNARNDTRAKLTWPSSILLGFGGAQDGGAAAGFLFDEHVTDDEQQRSGSVTKIIWERFIENSELKSAPKALFSILREINHIDDNGGAHPLHIGNLIKTLHYVDIFRDADINTVDRMDSSWKEASIYACIISFLMGEKDNVRNFNKQAVAAIEASLKFYSEHSKHKNNPEFEKIYKKLAYDCTRGFTKIKTEKPEDAKAIYLTFINENGEKEIVRDEEHSNYVQQMMLMPNMAALCKKYWGDKMANIILYPFWEMLVQQNLAYQEALKAINKVIKEHAKQDVLNETSEIGQISVLYSGYNIEADVKVNGVYEKKSCPIVLLDVSSANRSVFKAMHSVMNQIFNGVGYEIFRNLDKNSPSLILTRGKNIPVKIWERLVDILVRQDGSSDSRHKIGHWHRVTNSDGKLGTFILNGNAAHKYVPKIIRPASGFIELIKLAHKTFN